MPYKLTNVRFIKFVCRKMIIHLAAFNSLRITTSHYMSRNNLFFWSALHLSRFDILASIFMFVNSEKDKCLLFILRTQDRPFSLLKPIFCCLDVLRTRLCNEQNELDCNRVRANPDFVMSYGYHQLARSTPGGFKYARMLSEDRFPVTCVATSTLTRECSMWQPVSVVEVTVRRAFW